MPEVLKTDHTLQIPGNLAEEKSEINTFSFIEKLKHGYTAAFIRTLLADPEKGARFYDLFADAGFLKTSTGGQRTEKIMHMVTTLLRDPEIGLLFIGVIIKDMREYSLGRKKSILDVQQDIREGHITEEVLRVAVFDEIVVGAGPNASVYNITRSNVNPNIKSMTLESTDVISRNFSLFRNFLKINTDNTADTGDLPSLTGSNLNTFGKASVTQIPYIEPLRYPTGGRFADVATVDQFFSESELMMKVTVLREEHRGEIPGSDNWPAPIRLTILDEDSGKDFYIFTYRSIYATGLGKSTLPKLEQGLDIVKEQVARADLVLREIRETREQTEAIVDIEPPSRVMTYEQFVEYVSTVPTALRYFANKRIGIVGAGDSAYTILEYFMRLGDKSIYNKHVAQFGEPAALLALGLDVKNNRELLSKIYERYAQVSLGFATPEGVHEHFPFITPVSGRVVGVKKNGDEDSEYFTTMSQGRGGSTDVGSLSSQTSTDVDFLIIATGYENQIGKVFGSSEEEGGHSTRVVKNPFEDDENCKKVTCHFDEFNEDIEISRKLNDSETYILGPILGAQPRFVSKSHESGSSVMIPRKPTSGPTISMQSMSPRSEKLAEILATSEADHDLPIFKPIGNRVRTLVADSSLRETVQLRKTERRIFQNMKLPPVDKFNMRVLLAKILRECSIRTQEKGTLTIDINLIDAKTLDISIKINTGGSTPRWINEEGLSPFAKAVHDERGLLNNFFGLVAPSQRQKRSLSIVIPFNRKGIFEIQKMIINEQII